MVSTDALILTTVSRLSTPIMCPVTFDNFYRFLMIIYFEFITLTFYITWDIFVIKSLFSYFPVSSEITLL